MGWLLIAIGASFALNIGASGAASSMGAAYAGRALGRRTAQVLAALFLLVGAVVGGSAVVQTVGTGIVPARAMTPEGAVIVLAAACATLAFANYLRIPLSTSQVTVGAVIGLGIALRALAVPQVLAIAGTWLVFPLLAAAIAWFCGRFLHGPVSRCLDSPNSSAWNRRMLAVGLVAAGCYQAFAAGTNNVANAVGPLVGAGVLGSTDALRLGGLAMALGAASLGGQVLETNGRRITRLTLFGGTCVALIAGTLTLCASLVGIPVPLTQATTAAIAGLGAGAGGEGALNGRLVRRIALVWVASPVSAMMLAYVFTLTADPQIGRPELPLVLLAGGVASGLLVRQLRRRQQPPAQPEYRARLEDA